MDRGKVDFSRSVTYNKIRYFSRRFPDILISGKGKQMRKRSRMRKTIKKELSVSALCLAALMLLTACGGQNMEKLTAAFKQIKGAYF